VSGEYERSNADMRLVTYALSNYGWHTNVHVFAITQIG
jgi:hypothetical protein